MTTMNAPRPLFSWNVRTVEVEYTAGPDPYRERADIPETAAALCRAWMAHEHTPADRECLLILCTDSRHRVISAETLARGTANSAPVDGPALYRHALLVGAAGVILAHTHPSGALEPSRDDKELTRRVAKALTLLGLTLHDHLILTPDGRFLSLRSAAAELFTALI